jgi:LacI family transcriptional regulator
MPREGTAQGTGGGRRRTTISDLAEHLSLTKGTVSRALNDYPDIAEDTRLRVRIAAEQMGYRPLSHAQAIRTGRVRSIGLVLDVYEHDGHRPFLADFLAGLSSSAAQHDWTLTVTTAATEDDTARLLWKLHDERKVDGFILPRTYEHDDRVSALRAANVPHVLFGRIADLANTAFFDIAGEDAMVDAVGLLHRLGHRRIGFVSGGDGYMYTRLRQDGYIAGLEAVGLPFAPELIAGPAVSQVDGAAAARQLLSLDEPPTALVYAIDQSALGAYATARDFDLEIGRDLSVVSYDGIPEGALMVPQLSSFRVDMREAGERLAELLIRNIRGEAAGDLQEIAPAHFAARGSHGPKHMTSAELAARVAKSRSKGGLQ